MRTSRTVLATLLVSAATSAGCGAPTTSDDELADPFPAVTQRPTAPRTPAARRFAREATAICRRARVAQRPAVRASRDATDGSEAAAAIEDAIRSVAPARFELVQLDGFESEGRLGRGLELWVTRSNRRRDALRALASAQIDGTDASDVAVDARTAGVALAEASARAGFPSCGP